MQENISETDKALMKKDELLSSNKNQIKKLNEVLALETQKILDLEDAHKLQLNMLSSKKESGN